MAALTENKDFSNAVVGLTRSDDQMKRTAALSFLDARWRENRPAFVQNFPGVEAKMQLYQQVSEYLSPEEATKREMRADDPSTASARETLGKIADKETEGVDANTVLRKLAPHWLPFTGAGAPVSNDASASANAMLADWNFNYKDLRTAGMDQAGADAVATQRMQKIWGVSDTNGGRMMKYPPEQYYQKMPVGGFQYIKDQLNADVEAAATAQGIKLQAAAIAPGPNQKKLADTEDWERTANG